MKLLNRDRAVIQDEKLRDYLLSQAHPVGRFKAAFFHALGYRGESWETLETDIRALLRNQARTREKTEYGQKFEVRGMITGPSNKSAELVTVWIVLNGEDFPRFVTAYPGE